MSRSSSKIDTGNQFLREGEFENAKSTFADLLDEDPTSDENIAGFFIASYWDNRLDQILKTREGKERGKLLVKMFSTFEDEFLERELVTTPSYASITDCILEEAASHLKIAYQQEGMHGLEGNVLTDLAVCLIRISDFKNALEILNFARNFDRKSPELSLFKAECLLHLGDISQGKQLYRIGLLRSASSMRLELISSEPMHTYIQNLHSQLETEEDLREYLPVHCIEMNYFDSDVRIPETEIPEIFRTMKRLQENLGSKKKEFAFKIQCRLIQSAVAILDSCDSLIYSEEMREAGKILTSLDPTLLERRSRSSENY